MGNKKSKIVKASSDWLPDLPEDDEDAIPQDALPDDSPVVVHMDNSKPASEIKPSKDTEQESTKKLQNEKPVEPDMPLSKDMTAKEALEVKKIRSKEEIENAVVRDLKQETLKGVAKEVVKAATS
mmetsp:Transcript_9953/g.14943  ORF Transcript_9953/g.14943 Transcript_9953/m.14943 type:complete len:125 (-) Transcript_9953:315-689(-)|eukprot:CAMPEP_0167758582 /NCGR_PEP_ID=MMETSP0110_2-20121227/10547_1 /TAXON_ID=629695 /ORGANISM="Gymnochlora sp., Strain CCMP2014" /LENGTH=124 /DNA_ID=CAMNT_0007644871 /DNA_START=154 /DNA_END=528 /DNA_ORIENTATION=-